MPWLRVQSSLLRFSCVAAVHKQFFGTPAAGPPAASDPAAVYIDGWEEMQVDAVVLGEASAPVVLVEFVDFQCGFCRRFHASYEIVREQYGDHLALWLLHYPLQMHDHALPAAHAVECADRQGAAAPFVDLVFAVQDSLGTKSWESFAEDAGLADIADFAECLSSDPAAGRVEKGRFWGEHVGVRGTPTILVNGWLLRPPPYEPLETVVERALTGEWPNGAP